jgi:hypothetical protein
MFDERRPAGRLFYRLLTVLLFPMMLQARPAPRLSRSQSYFLPRSDASTPARYSRCSTALHVDYPLGGERTWRVSVCRALPC